MNLKTSDDWQTHGQCHHSHCNHQSESGWGNWPQLYKHTGPGDHTFYQDKSSPSPGKVRRNAKNIDQCQEICQIQWTLHLEELWFESLESSVVSPGLTNQRNTKIQLIQIVENLVYSWYYFAAVLLERFVYFFASKIIFQFRVEIGKHVNHFIIGLENASSKIFWWKILIQFFLTRQKVSHPEPPFLCWLISKC